MDNSHVALISVELMAPGFKKYRCDRPMPLGVNLNSLSKVLKCAKDDDQVTLKAGDNNDVLNLLYESPSTDRIAEYEMKLMDIDVDQLGIPDTAYDASIVMSSAEFARIVRDLSNLGESVKIEVSKEGIRFSSEGDTANGNVLLKHSEDAAKKYKGSGGAKGEGSSKGKGKEKEEKPKVKKEKNDDDDDDATMADPTQVEDDEIIEVKAGSDAEEEEEDEKKSDDEKEASGEEEEEDDDDDSSKKRKRKANGDAKGKKSKKAKKVSSCHLFFHLLMGSRRKMIRKRKRRKWSKESLFGCPRPSTSPSRSSISSTSLRAHPCPRTSSCN
jgi:proliferating cell nuclear antigen